MNLAIALVPTSALILASLGDSPAAASRSDWLAVGSEAAAADVKATALGRWIVTFEGDPLSLTPLRNAIEAGASAEEYAVRIAHLEALATERSRPIEQRLAALGGRVVTTWWLINGCAIQASTDAVSELMSMEGVASVEPDLPSTYAAATAAPAAPIKAATNADNHNVDRLHAFGIAGAGTTIAVVDTGFDSVSGSQNRPHRTFFVDGDPNNTTGIGLQMSRLLENRQIGAVPADNSDTHGTAVAACAAGGDWGTAGADHGHAYKANIVGYSVLDINNFPLTQASYASQSTLVSAWQSVVTDRVAFGITTANFSWHILSNASDPVGVAVDRAASGSDLLICAIAGNQFTDTTYAPLALNCIQIGNVETDTHALYANSGRGVHLTDMVFPDLCANGTFIVAPRVDFENVDILMTGTSFAAPMVSGTAAILRAAFPGLRAEETKAILLAAAGDMPGSSDRLEPGVGAGYMQSVHAYLVASKSSQHGYESFQSTNDEFRRSIALQAGETCNLAISWFRHDYSVTAPMWSDFELNVELNGTAIPFTGNTVQNTEAFMRFTAPSTGTYQLVVTANHLDRSSVAFGWAASCDTTAP